MEEFKNIKGSNCTIRRGRIELLNKKEKSKLVKRQAREEISEKSRFGTITTLPTTSSKNFLENANLEKLETILVIDTLSKITSTEEYTSVRKNTRTMKHDTAC